MNIHYSQHHSLNTTQTHTTARPEDREQTEAEIRKAHVICIVYAIDDPNTFNRLSLYWLPYIRSLGVNVTFLYFITSFYSYFFFL